MRCAVLVNVLACFSLLLTPFVALHAHVGAGHAEVTVHGGHFHDAPTHHRAAHHDSSEHEHAAHGHDHSLPEQDSNIASGVVDVAHTHIVSLAADVASGVGKHSIGAFLPCDSQVLIEPAAAVPIRISLTNTHVGFASARPYLHPPLRGPPASIL
jgi:hypothetical protein